MKIRHLLRSEVFLKTIGIPLLLVTAIVITYWQVFSFGFLRYDTPLYVTENLKVLAGITPDNIRWSLLTNFFSNWHPLTWLSHMLDVDIWGTNPGGHHATSLFLHILNSLLIFSLFQKMTAKTWESAALAAFFALHPLHIESVAWIAERKDVLSAFFLLLSILCYFYYVRVQSLTLYLLTLFTFTLALMSKPMVVTFPFVLLLLDYWPLDRFRRADNPGDQQKLITSNAVLSITLEKIPFVLLAAIGSWLTLLAQKASMVNLDSLPLAMRLANSCTAYLGYIAKTFWPVNLSVLYPHPGMPSFLKIFAATCLIISISLIVIKWWRTRPWLLSGWLWFLGTLVPVIGIVQVGHQAMADRYTYIPHIGLFFMIVWGASTAFQQFHVPRRVLICITLFFILGCGIMTQHQLRYWQNDATLFARAITTTGDNYIAEINLGGYHLSNHNLEEAEKHLRRAVQINSSNSIAYANLGKVYSLSGKSQEAIENYQTSLKVGSNTFESSLISHFSLATEFEKIGLPLEAIFHYKKVIEVNPKSIPAYINIGKLYIQLNELNKAQIFLQQALSIDPNNLSLLKDVDKILQAKKT